MKWFNKKPSKTQCMDDNRILLLQRCDKIEEDIALLENRESSTLQAGKDATSNLVKRRLAAQLCQLRKNIDRKRQTISMLNTQINVYATDLHNRTIIETAKTAQLPSTHELTEHAIAAEQILEAIVADADMANGFETNQFTISDEEAAIMKEFEIEEKAVETSENSGRDNCLSEQMENYDVPDCMREREENFAEPNYTEPF